MSVDVGRYDGWSGGERAKVRGDRTPLVMGSFKSIIMSRSLIIIWPVI